MKKIKRGYYCLVLTAVGFVLSSVLVVSKAQSTPSTTFWSPSTPYLQPFGVLHITYNTYFNHKTAYPIITDLTIGLLPLKELNWEFGFDLLLPSKKISKERWFFLCSIIQKLGLRRIHFSKVSLVGPL